MLLDPLPFRLNPTGRDTLAFEGIESVSYCLDGFLRLADQGVTLEWAGTRTSEQVSLDRIGTRVVELPLEWVELPFQRLAAAWVIGGWWWPRLELRARSVEDFDEVPTARGITLRLRIHRRDRELARAVAAEIEAGVAASVLEVEEGG